MLLLIDIKSAPTQRRPVRVRRRMMEEIFIVSIVGRQCADQAPRRRAESMNVLNHVASAETLTYGASELGSTDPPRTTRKLTRIMSPITTHRIATSITEIAASRR